MAEEMARGRRKLPADTTPAADSFLPGSRVEVRTRFEGQWAGGYEYLGVGDGGVRVRRRSDGFEIPRHFENDDIRPQDRSRD